ncbi:hypothetical protein [Streptomyces sp. NPDC059949]|uniref:hypothetical protein n=1 Tax=Streptomyces sp. NPDC059949 TaxID=3347013 RepID=UPI0036463305
MQTATLRKTLRGCRISRGDLDDIIGVILSDAGDHPVVRFEVERGISSIEMDNLDALLSELRNPASLDSLSIRVSSPTFSRRTSIDLRNGELTLRVWGDGETWVRGRFDELLARLADTRRRLSPSSDVMFFSSSLIAVAGLIAISAISDTVLTAVGGMLVYAAVLVPLINYLYRRSRSVVLLHAPSAGSVGPGAFNVTVGVLTIGLAVAGLWISWSAWQHPVK